LKQREVVTNDMEWELSENVDDWESTF